MRLRVSSLAAPRVPHLGAVCPSGSSAGRLPGVPQTCRPGLAASERRIQLSGCPCTPGSCTPTRAPLPPEGFSAPSCLTQCLWLLGGVPQGLG